MAGHPKGVAIKITYKAFEAHIQPTDGHFVTSVIVDWLEGVGLSDDEVLEEVFRATNTYSGSLWNLIEPLLSQYRTHTAVSVGDEVSVNGNTYRCEFVGWKPITPHLGLVTS